MENTDTLISAIEDDIQLSEDDVMLLDEITDKFLDAISFKEIIELMPHGELTKEALVNVIDCYDYIHSIPHDFWPVWL